MTVVMMAEGNLTIPADVRQAPRLAGGPPFEIEACDGVLELCPIDIISDKDLWAYRPEHLHRVERARAEMHACLVRSWPSDK